MFLLKKVLATLLLPPVSPLLVAAFGLWLARRQPRLGRALAALAIASLWLLATPWMADRLLGSLQEDPPIAPEALDRAQAIVVLGAGTYHDAPEYGGDTVNDLALARLRYAARLARTSGLPVAVTGGAPSGGQPEGESMRLALAEDFGVATRWVETRSRDTAENASYLAPMLKQDGIARIALVTHAWHMPRARYLFAHAGMEVLAAPTAFVTDGTSESELRYLGTLLPNAGALRRSCWAAHEWLGRWASIMRISIDRHFPAPST